MSHAIMNIDEAAYKIYSVSFAKQFWSVIYDFNLLPMLTLKPTVTTFDKRFESVHSVNSVPQIHAA